MEISLCSQLWYRKLNIFGHRPSLIFLPSTTTVQSIYNIFIILEIPFLIYIFFLLWRIILIIISTPNKKISSSFPSQSPLFKFFYLRISRTSSFHSVEIVCWGFYLVSPNNWWTERISPLMQLFIDFVITNIIFFVPSLISDLGIVFVLKQH